METNPVEPGKSKKHADPWAGMRKLLAVADVQTGYHHDSISQALATVQRLGRESGAYATNIRTDSQLITRQPIIGQGARYGGKNVNARNLNDYNAIFLLPSGEGTLCDEQKEDLLAFVRDDGKGLILGHAALLGFYDWPEFGALAGARFAGEFDGPATVRVEDPTFPGSDAFGSETFTFEEQHPILKDPYRRDRVNVILSLDPGSVDRRARDKRDDDDFPVVWTHQYGKGRVFNFGWGHAESTWDDPRFQQMVLEGIKWTLSI